MIEQTDSVIDTVEYAVLMSVKVNPISLKTTEGLRYLRENRKVSQQGSVVSKWIMKTQWRTDFKVKINNVLDEWGKTHEEPFIA